MATVSASGELAQGQMTSCRRPLLWNTLRNASQEEIDPGVEEGPVVSGSNVMDQSSPNRRRSMEKALHFMQGVIHLTMKGDSLKLTELMSLKNIYFCA